MLTKERMSELMEKHHVSQIDMVFVNESKEMSVYRIGDDSLEDGMFAACSLSKFVTTILILKLVENRKLSLDSPINDYFASFSLND